MPRLPIRLRLALAFTAILAVVLLAVGLFLQWRLGETLEESLVDELEVRHEELAALAEEPGGMLGSGLPALEEREEGVVQLLSPSGAVLVESGGLEEPLVGPATLEQALTGQVLVGGASVPAAEDPYRLLAGPVTTREGKGVLVVGRSTEDISEAMAGFRAQVLLGGPLILIAGFVLAYLLTVAALRPVEAMRRKAAEIESVDLAERLPVPPGDDELARLGVTLNDLLGRVAASVEREKSFVADAGHELRTPLAAMRMELDLALRRSRTPAELEAALRSASAESERLSRLAEDLLTLSRAEQGSLGIVRARVPARELLEGVGGRFRARAAAEGRDLVVDAPSGVEVFGDRARLEQALGNLVDNALRHGAGRVTLGANECGGTLRLVVSDEGAGFGPEVLPRAFDRFSQADPSRGTSGAGLGLSIVRAIAETHGGSVRAEDLAGGGARVALEIPSAPPRPAGDLESV